MGDLQSKFDILCSGYNEYSSRVGGALSQLTEVKETIMGVQCKYNSLIVRLNSGKIESAIAKNVEAFVDSIAPKCDVTAEIDSVLPVRICSVSPVTLLTSSDADDDVGFWNFVCSSMLTGVEPVTSVECNDDDDEFWNLVCSSMLSAMEPAGLGGSVAAAPRTVVTPVLEPDAYPVEMGLFVVPWDEVQDRRGGLAMPEDLSPANSKYYIMAPFVGPYMRSPDVLEWGSDNVILNFYCSVEELFSQERNRSGIAQDSSPFLSSIYIGRASRNYSSKKLQTFLFNHLGIITTCKQLSRSSFSSYQVTVKKEEAHLLLDCQFYRDNDLVVRPFRDSVSSGSS